jgi:hypothetical protein
MARTAVKPQPSATPLQDEAGSVSPNSVARLTMRARAVGAAGDDPAQQQCQQKEADDEGNGRAHPDFHCRKRCRAATQHQRPDGDAQQRQAKNN